jgi:hypothetical protein
VRGVDDGRAASGAGAVSFFESETLPQGISELLARHNFQVEYDALIGKKKRRMDYREESFDLNEQIACLGVIKDGVDWTGAPVKVLHPIQQNTLNEAYFTQQEWSDTDREIWNEFTRTPSIVVSDDSTISQGVIIPIAPVIPTVPVLAWGAQYGVPQPSQQLMPAGYPALPQQQGYPPQLPPGYPPTPEQSGYTSPQQQPGYPPQQPPGYHQQQQLGYPQQQQSGYPPQQQSGYPPPQQLPGYPQQQLPGYHQQQQSGYPQQQQSGYTPLQSQMYGVEAPGNYPPPYSS